jgi:hypothetical protein
MIKNFQEDFVDLTPLVFHFLTCNIRTPGVNDVSSGNEFVVVRYTKVPFNIKTYL